MYFLAEWLGERRWQRYAADAHARGVKLWITDFTRPEIPEDQNFAALPMMKAAFAGRPNSFDLPWSKPTNVGTSIFATAGGRPSSGSPVKGEAIDWTDWQRYFQAVGYLSETSDQPAHDVLRALEHFAPQFQEWSQWRTHPQCRFPIDLAQGVNMTLPHLSTMQSAARVFALRMQAHLAQRDSAAAYADFQEGFQAYRCLKDEPTLISGLVRQSILTMLVNAVGTGLHDSVWADGDLQKLDSDLGAIRIWDDCQLALVSERASLNTTSAALLHLRRSDRADMVISWYGGGTASSSQSFFFALLPRSFFRDNQIRLDQFLEELEARIDRAHQSFDPDKPTPSSPAQITDTISQYYFTAARIHWSSCSYVEGKYIRVQTLLDEARLACALERFRLKHGAYPATLGELAPEFMAIAPTDVYAHAPYHYVRTEAGSFRLYGVGEDRIDGGGVVDPTKTESRQADAIWLYAPTGTP